MKKIFTALILISAGLTAFCFDIARPPFGRSVRFLHAPRGRERTGK